MNQQIEIQARDIPTKRQLVKATGVALLVALILLMTLILPAEFGIDPLRTGRLLGLTQMSTASPLPEDVRATAGAAKLIPVQEGAVSHYSAEYKFDATEFTLGPYEYVEYKYHLEQGASMQYAWTADSNLVHDFHGEREGGPANSEESFDKRERRQAFGTLIAPFAGIHGWYWENPGGESVTINLKTSGFYSSAVEIHSDRTRHIRQLTSLENVTVPAKPAPPASR